MSTHPRLGKHTTMQKETRHVVDWLSRMEGVKKVILGPAEACRHSFRPGDVKFVRELNPGMLVVRVYDGVGVRNVRVIVATPEHGRAVVQRVMAKAGSRLIRRVGERAREIVAEHRAVPVVAPAIVPRPIQEAGSMTTTNTAAGQWITLREAQQFGWGSNGRLRKLVRVYNVPRKAEMMGGRPVAYFDGAALEQAHIQQKAVTRASLIKNAAKAREKGFGTRHTGQPLTLSEVARKVQKIHTTLARLTAAIERYGFQTTPTVQ